MNYSSLFKIKSIFIISSVLLILNSFIYSKTPEIEDQETKLYSCYRLIRIRIKEDKDFLFDYVNSYVKLPNVGKETIKSKSVEELTSLVKDNLIVTCFNEISLLKAAELRNNLDNRINPFTKENKDLISVEVFNTKFHSNANSKFSKVLEQTNSIASNISENEEFKNEISNFDKSFPSKLSEVLSNDFNKRKNTNNDNKKSNTEEDLYLDQSDYSNLNLNVFGYNLNDPFIKNTIGAGLLVLIFFGIFWSYKLVSYKEQVKVSNKQKKKEKKEKLN